MRELLETDLRWRCGRVQRIEDTSPRLLDPNTVPDYIGDLRETARALREVLHAAMGLLADAEQRNERLRARNRELTMCRADRDGDGNRDSLRNRASARTRTATGRAEQSIAKTRKAEGQESSRDGDRGKTATRQAPGQVQAQGQRQGQKQLRPQAQAQGKVASWT